MVWEKREKPRDTLEDSGWDEGIPVFDPEWGTGQRGKERETRTRQKRARERKCSH